MDDKTNKVMQNGKVGDTCFIVTNVEWDCTDQYYHVAFAQSLKAVAVIITEVTQLRGAKAGIVAYNVKAVERRYSYFVRENSRKPYQGYELFTTLEGAELERQSRIKKVIKDYESESAETLANLKELLK